MNILSFHGADYLKSPSGSEKQLSLIHKEFSKRGHNIYHICTNPKIRESKKVSIGKRISIFYVPLYNALIDFFYSIRLIIFLSRFKKDIDLIYIREYYNLVPIIFFSKSNKIPIVFSISSDNQVIPLYKRNLSYFLDYHNLGPISQPRILNKIIFDLSINTFSEVICQHEGQRDSLTKNYNIKSKLVYNCHTPKSIKKIPNLKIFSWIGHIRSIKNIESFLELSRMFEKENIKFIVAGKIPKSEYGLKISKLIKKSKNVKYLGSLEMRDVLKLLNASIALVNTSFTEGFSNTFVESWSQSTPVISLYADPGNIIQIEKLGYFSENMEQIKKDVNNILNNREKLLSLSENSFRFYLDNFKIDNNIDKYYKIFRGIINDK